MILFSQKSFLFFFSTFLIRIFVKKTERKFFPIIILIFNLILYKNNIFNSSLYFLLKLVEQIRENLDELFILNLSRS